MSIYALTVPQEAVVASRAMNSRPPDPLRPRSASSQIRSSKYDSSLRSPQRVSEQKQKFVSTILKVSCRPWLRKNVYFGVFTRPDRHSHRHPQRYPYRPLRARSSVSGAVATSTAHGSVTNSFTAVTLRSASTTIMGMWSDAAAA